MQPALQTDTRKIYTVTEVTRDIRSLLEDNFPSLWITGEISNFKPAASGHFYFTLKDESSQLPSVMFRGANGLLKFMPEDGLEVVAHGRLSVYEPRGAYQIIVDYLEPKGLGALQLAFEQLKNRLSAEGLFDEKYKKPLTYLPKKIGIITSSKGAVLHDILSILTRRFSNIDIVVNPVRVQGDGAAQEIAQAIREMNERTDIDLLIVGRGGGSLEDLWAFNEEVVVRAIFASRIPLISAVGHETDYTLADLAADLRAPTPSAAAELAVPEKMELVRQIEECRSSLVSAMRLDVGRLREGVLSLRKRLKEPKKVLEDFKLRLDELWERFITAEKRALQDKRRSLREIVLRLKDLSPQNILKKGFSIVFKQGTVSQTSPTDKIRKPLRSAREVEKGEMLDIRFYEGEVKVKVV